MKWEETSRRTCADIAAASAREAWVKIGAGAVVLFTASPV